MRSWSRRLARRCLHIQIGPESAGGAGQTLPSQCHLEALDVMHVKGSKNLFLSITCAFSSPRSCPPAPAGRGAGRDRTDDLMLAKHALYQLSYSPHRGHSRLGRRCLEISSADAASVSPARACGLVGPGGLEPPTSRLSGVCSNQLSYRPEPLQRGALAIAFRPAAVARVASAGSERLCGKGDGDGGIPHLVPDTRSERCLRTHQ